VKRAGFIPVSAFRRPPKTDEQKLQQTQTNVRCPKCREAFRLSGEDTVIFLTRMRVQVECPHCLNQAEISALATGTMKSGPSGLSGNYPASARKKVAQAPVTKVGIPPFKPLGKEPPAPTVEATRSIPFPNLVVPNPKPSQKETSRRSEGNSSEKSWLASQSKLTKALMVLVVVLAGGMAFLAVQVSRKSGLKQPGNQTAGRPGTEAVQKTGNEVAPVQAPSEDSPQGGSGRKGAE